MREITPRFEFLSGSFDLDTTKIICIPSRKYTEVELCIQGPPHVPFAKIKLYDSGLLKDAELTYEESVLLGEEICKRFNKSRMESNNG